MESLVPPHHNLHFRYHFPHLTRPPSIRRSQCHGGLLPRVAVAVWVMPIVALTTLSIIGCSPTPSQSAPSLSFPVQAILLCDNSIFHECVQYAQVMVEEAALFSRTSHSLSPTVSLNVSVVRIPSDGPEALRTLISGGAEVAEGEELRHADVFVAVGGSGAVETATVLARGLDKPLLGYVDGDSWKDTYKPLTTEDYLSANPDPMSQGATLALLVGQFNMPYTYILIQDIFLGSGFLEGFRSKGDSQYKDSFLGQSTLGSQMTDDQIDILLEELSMKGWKVIVLHCQPHLTMRVVQQSVAMNLFGTGHGWFLSETAMTYDPEELRHLPVGLLGVRGFYRNSTRGLLQASARTISCAYACMQECFHDTLLPVPSSSSSSSSSMVYNLSSSSSSSNLPLSLLFKRSSSSSDISLSSSSPSPFSSLNLDSISLRGKFRVSCNDTTQYFTKCVRYSPICQQQQTDVHSRSSFPNASNSSSKPTPNHPHSSQHCSSSSILQRGTAYHLLNLVHNGPDERMWESVGFISANGQTNLKTVMWPGRTFFGPSSVTTKTYRVVTRPARPFVYADGPVTSEDECFADVPCLQLRNSSKPYVMDSVQDFVSRHRRANTDYSIFCCKGISLEILKRLSEDLNFQYVIYFVNNSNYGDFHNNTWSGMVGDVLSGSADLIVGAFSVTSSRMQAISFTEPFYQNDFSLVTREDGQTPSIWAFLSPFSAQVWTCILLSSIVAGVATSSLEWFSPFGLNPRGRKRNKQYSLGSGLLMVWVLVTGHTINIKAPKSWPSKVIQNVWAGLAIFIMTSYTANLAAYLAGQSAVISVKGIFDSKLLQKRVSVIKSTAVEHLLQQINPDLYRITRHNYVNSTADGIRKLLLDETDVFLDDYELLEYEVNRIDKDCKIQFVGKGFGSDGYAIGLPKNSWMRAALSDKILQYTETGFIQELSKKYLIQSRCGYFLSGSAVQYGLEHTGGLFIILLSAVFISVFLLVLEHLAYKFLIPWFRSRPACSFWKTENVAFFSQRVHRVVRSERLYSQKQAAQEMITIVKQRDFTRLIQKHELQKRKIPPQKRVKTKAEMFQEITANIVSYHRQLKEPDMMMWVDEQRYTHDQGGPDTKEGSGNNQEGGLVAYDVVQDRHGMAAQTLATSTILEENHVGVNNLAYFPDAELANCSLRADSSNSRSDGTDEELDVCKDDDISTNLDPSNSVIRSSPSKRSTRIMWSSPRRKLSAASIGGSSAGSRDRRDIPLSPVVMGASASEPNSPEPRQPWEPVSGKPGKGQFHSPQHRRESDISPVRLPGNRPMQNNTRSRSQDYQNWDYFQRNMGLKDNRINSPSSRGHPLAAYQSQIPAGCMDYCTLRAMSKEDLLMLWKQSELELQTKLNDVHNRNKRLALAIDYLTKQEESDELLAEEV